MMAEVSGADETLEPRSGRNITIRELGEDLHMSKGEVDEEVEFELDDEKFMDVGMVFAA